MMAVMEGFTYTELINLRIYDLIFLQKEVVRISKLRNKKK